MALRSILAATQTKNIAKIASTLPPLSYAQAPHPMALSPCHCNNKAKGRQINGPHGHWGRSVGSSETKKNPKTDGTAISNPNPEDVATARWIVMLCNVMLGTPSDPPPIPISTEKKPQWRINRAAHARWHIIRNAPFGFAKGHIKPNAHPQPPKIHCSVEIAIAPQRQRKPRRQS